MSKKELNYNAIHELLKEHEENKNIKTIILIGFEDEKVHRATNGIINLETTLLQIADAIQEFETEILEDTPEDGFKPMLHRFINHYFTNKNKQKEELKQ